MKTGPLRIEDFAKIEADQTITDEYEFFKLADEVAKSRGQIVVIPRSNQLQLDLDSDASLKEAQRRYDYFDFDAEWEQHESKTKGHWHVTITFEEGKVFNEWERLALQAALGSDPFREYLNVLRKVRGVENPTRLFETP